MTCSIDGCENTSITRGWCPMHYSRFRRHGDPLIRYGVRSHVDIRVQFAERIEVSPGGCWLWTGRLNVDGYGVLNVPGASPGVHLAHRLAYEWFVGPIPDGFHIDHIHANGCRHRNCVNWVDHLEPVTPAENLRRARAVNIKPACGKGHLFTPENTYIPPSTGSRICRTCNIARARAAHLRKRRAPA